jgi:hypothetical protein
VSLGCFAFKLAFDFFVMVRDAGAAAIVNSGTILPMVAHSIHGDLGVEQTFKDAGLKNAKTFESK